MPIIGGDICCCWGTSMYTPTYVVFLTWCCFCCGPNYQRSQHTSPTTRKYFFASWSRISRERAATSGLAIIFETGRTSGTNPCANASIYWWRSIPPRTPQTCLYLPVKRTLVVWGPKSNGKTEGLLRASLAWNKQGRIVMLLSMKGFKGNYSDFVIFLRQLILDYIGTYPFSSGDVHIC